MILTVSLGHEHLFHVTVPNHIHTELAEGDRTAFESRTVMMASDSGDELATTGFGHLATGPHAAGSLDGQRFRRVSRDETENGQSRPHGIPARFTAS